MKLPAALLLLAAALVAPAAAAEPPAPSTPAPPVTPAPPAPPAFTAPPYAMAPYAYGGPYPEPPVTERRSPGMRVSGIALWFVGGLAGVAGTGAFGYSVAHPCQSFVELGAPTPQNDRHAPGRARARTPVGGPELVGTAQDALLGSGSCGSALGEFGLGVFAVGALVAAVGIPLFVMGDARVPARGIPEVHLGTGSAELSFRF